MSFPGLLVDPDRVAIYIRWSTEEQSGGTTLEVQRESCEHYVLAQGWKVQPHLIFIDDGYSGGSLERPGLDRLRAAIRRGQITCVVTFKLDRLSRSVIDTVNLVLQEWEGLCYIKSTREPVDTSSSAGKMFFYMLASYAEWERSTIKERTMSGKVKRAQQGKNPGYVLPYGYACGEKPGEWAVDEREAGIVRRVFTEYMAGKGIHAIAAGLYADGVKPRRAKHWHATTITQMLTNTTYTGVLEYGRTTAVPKGLREQVGTYRMTFAEPRYARVEGAVPIIITSDLFERAQRVREGKAVVQGKRALSAQFLLTGIARCTCGGWLRGDSRVKKGIRYYRCTNTMASRPEPCKAGMIPAGDLDEMVVATVMREFDPANLHRYAEDWRRGVQEQLQRAEERLGTVQEALFLMVRRRARLDADYDAGDLSAKLYSSRIEQLEAEEVRLRETLVPLQAEMEQIRQARFQQGEFEAIAGKVDAWAHLTPEERKQVLRYALAACVAFRTAGNGQAGARPIEASVTIWRPSATAAG